MDYPVGQDGNSALLTIMNLSGGVLRLVTLIFTFRFVFKKAGLLFFLILQGRHGWYWVRRNLFMFVFIKNPFII